MERELTGEIVDPEDKEEEEEPLNDPKNQESKDNIMGEQKDTEEITFTQTLK